jgi:outer membrane protein OmpA-like peptidoglycan-associated protein/WD40 repeat protein
MPCLYNYSVELKGAARGDALQKAAAADAAFHDYAKVQDLYFYYLDTAKDATRADAFLKQFDLAHPGVFITDYILGLRAQNNDKDLKKAEKYYLSAIDKNPRSLDALESLCDLRLQLMPDNADADTRAAAVQPVVDYIKLIVAEDKDKASDALLYVAERAAKELKSASTALQYYKLAFRVQPTAEAALGVVSDASVISREESEQFLLTALESLPKNHAILNSLAKHAADNESARTYYDKAIQYSPTLKDEATNAFDEAYYLYEDRLGDYSRAEQTFLRYLNRGYDRANSLRSLYQNRREACDFTAALKYFDQYESYQRSLGNINEAYFRARRNELEQILREQSVSDEFYRRHPFLGTWQKEFGESLKISVNFGTGSAEIPRADYPTLAKIAQAIKEGGADQYIFAVEGHTDDVGGEPVNQPLSERRARSVAEHLNSVYNIPMSRLRFEGYGSSVPLAPNTTEAGRARNRRVEILPVGAISEPSVLATAALRPGGRLAFALAPGGRYAAVGGSPMELWDMRLGIKLKEFGSAGARAFSPNGRYIAAISNYTEPGSIQLHAIRIDDVKTGACVAEFPVDSTLLYVAWDPSGENVAVGDGRPGVGIYSLALKRRVRNLVIPNDRYMRGLIWTKDGRYIITAQAVMKELMVWNADTLTLARTLPGVDWPHSLSQTEDGKYIIATDNVRTATVWNRDTWSSRQLTNLPVVADAVAVHPFKPLLLLDDFSGGPHHAALFDVANMRVTATADVGNDSPAYAFSADGTHVFRTEDRGIGILDSVTLKRLGETQGTASTALAGAGDTKNGLYLTADSEGVSVWDVQTGKKIHAWKTDLDTFLPVAGHPDQFITEISDEKSKTTRVTLLETSGFTQRELLTLPYNVYRTFITANLLCVAGVPFLPPSQGAETGTVEIYDLATMKLRSRFDVPMVTEALRYGRISYAGFTGFAVTRDGSEALLATSWVDGFGNSGTQSKSVRIFNTSTGQVVRRIDTIKGVDDLRLAENDAQVGVSLGGFWYLSDRKTGQYLRRDDLYLSENRIALRGGKSVVWSRVGIRLDAADPGARRLIDVPDIVNTTAYEDRNLLAVLDEKNEIRFYNLTTFEPLVNMIGKKNDEWIAWASTGEFASSLHGTDKVYWSLGDAYLDFSALRSRFEKPGILSDRLGSAARNTANNVPAAEAPAPAISADLFAVPYRVELLSPADVTTSEQNAEVRFRTVKQRAGLPDPVLVFSQNGMTIPAERRIAPVAAAGNPGEVRRSFELSEGINVIQANIRYQNAEIAGPAIRITRTAARASARTGQPAAPTTDLWFFGIGISKYESPNIEQLHFADRDARDIADQFAKQEGKLYRKVHTKLLLNEQAKARDIEVQMNDFLLGASSQDLIVIFVSGHGLQDSRQALYLVSSDADPEKPYTGFAVSKFNLFLKDRPPTQKAIFWLDVCHAGAANQTEARKGRVSMEDAIKQLADGTGLMVFASSTGAESSLESENFGGGHGAFSAALLEGMKGRAGHGAVTLNDLQSYVSRRVVEMTAKRQHPTTPLSENLLDFPVVAAQ